MLFSFILALCFCLKIENGSSSTTTEEQLTSMNDSLIPLCFVCQRPTETLLRLTTHMELMTARNIVTHNPDFPWRNSSLPVGKRLNETHGVCKREDCIYSIVSKNNQEKDVAKSKSKHLRIKNATEITSLHAAPASIISTSTSNRLGRERFKTTSEAFRILQDHIEICGNVIDVCGSKNDVIYQELIRQKSVVLVMILILMFLP